MVKVEGAEQGPGLSRSGMLSTMRMSTASNKKKQNQKKLLLKNRPNTDHAAKDTDLCISFFNICNCMILCEPLQLCEELFLYKY